MKAGKFFFIFLAGAMFGTGLAISGMFVNAGARNRLLKGEREKFLAEEWPRVSATIERLGITPDELTRAAAGTKKKGTLKQ